MRAAQVARRKRRKRAGRGVVDTRREIDVALHFIDHALDELLDRVLEPEAVPAAPPDLSARLRELFADNDVDAGAIDIVVEGEHVTLVGSVGDALARLLVEDLAWSLPEVQVCENRLAVAGAA